MAEVAGSGALQCEEQKQLTVLMEAAEEHLHSPFHVDRSKVKITEHDTWHVVLQGVKCGMHRGTAQSILA